MGRRCSYHFRIPKLVISYDFFHSEAPILRIVGRMKKVRECIVVLQLGCNAICTYECKYVFSVIKFQQFFV